MAAKTVPAIRAIIAASIAINIPAGIDDPLLPCDNAKAVIACHIGRIFSALPYWTLARLVVLG